MQAAYGALVQLEKTARHRAVTWLVEALEITDLVAATSGTADASRNAVAERSGSSGTEEEPGPREFMSMKKPESQAERIACLAYYLARYRDTKHFKSPQISALNVEAAGQKFGNLPRDMDNADRGSGYIVSAGKGMKQLTIRGEALVDAMPDREAVRIALREHPYRPKRSAGTGKKTVSAVGEDQ